MGDQSCPYASAMNPLARLARFIGTKRWLMKIEPLIPRIETFLAWLTGGRVSVLRIAGLPGLRLTVLGRKSGQPRTTNLLCAPYQDGFLVNGSNWGHPKHPVWTANLVAADTAEVVLWTGPDGARQAGHRRRSRPVMARAPRRVAWLPDGARDVGPRLSSVPAGAGRRPGLTVGRTSIRRGRPCRPPAIVRRYGCAHVECERGRRQTAGVGVPCGCGQLCPPRGGVGAGLCCRARYR